MTSRTVQLVTTGPDDTRRMAAVVAGALRPGDVVSLTGELGAGKTCFVQGAALALGVTERVTSPSFLLRRDYRGTVAVQHLDVYRLDTLQEVVELGFAEDTVADRVTFIEWGDAMRPLLPAGHLEVEFHLAPAEDAPPDLMENGHEERRIVVRPHGEDWLRRIVGLAVDVQAWRPDMAEVRLDPEQE